MAPPPPTARRVFTNTELARAAAAWDKAPLHVKAMAGAYVQPLLSTLAAVSAELGEIQTRLNTPPLDTP